VLDAIPRAWSFSDFDYGLLSRYLTMNLKPRSKQRTMFQKMEYLRPESQPRVLFANPGFHPIYQTVNNDRYDELESYAEGRQFARSTRFRRTDL
jgi:hypothetical protein